MSTIEEDRGKYTAAQRKALAAKGHAMPDGSYPIEDAEDVKSAADLAGHSKTYSDAEVKAHVKKRAKAIGATNMLPKSWLSDSEQEQKNSAGPRGGEEIRAARDLDIEIRASEERDGRLGTLCGHFARFNEWTTIDSAHEGKFMERIAPGAFKKTIEENRSGMRVLFNHGADPSVGNKVLGPIDVLREDDEGAYYEVPLLDTSYNRDLVPGLENGLYGASFRFRVLRQKIERPQRRTDMNPDQLPERTVAETAVREFGPVTFGAYDGATSGMRSMSDHFLVANLALENPARLQQIVSWLPTERFDSDTTTEYDVDQDAPPETRRAARAPVSGRRGNAATPLYGVQKRRSPSWLLPR